MKKRILNVVALFLIFFSSNLCLGQGLDYQKQDNSNFPTVNNIQFDYISSSISNNEMTITFTFNSLNEEKVILIKSENPSVIDLNGNEYPASSFKIGNNTIERDSYWGQSLTAKLFQNVPIKAEFVFPNVPNDLEEINLLQFNFIHLLDGRGVKNEMRKEYKVRLRNLTIN